MIDSTKEQIIEELKKNNRLTRNELAQKAGVSPNAVKQHLSDLKKMGKIIRKGSTKSGYWEIID